MLPIAVGFKFGLEKRHLGGNAKYAVQPFSGIMQKTIGLDKSTQKNAGRTSIPVRLQSRDIS